MTPSVSAPTTMVHRRAVGVSATTDARLTALLDRIVRSRSIAHTSLIVASDDAHAGRERPAMRAPPAPRCCPTHLLRGEHHQALHRHAGAAGPRTGRAAPRRPTDRSPPPSITVGLHVLHGVDHTPRITLHHLLSHTSGLPDHFDRPRGGRSLYRQLAAGEDRRWSFEDLVRAVRDDHTPHFVPQDLAARRAKARYSDTGFQLLIATLERATGRSFATLLTERIVTPWASSGPGCRNAPSPWSRRRRRRSSTTGGGRWTCPA
jgi:D-alanyl-D-alanine carboxypeptidase